jgi:hypothetical protein
MPGKSSLSAVHSIKLFSCYQALLVALLVACHLQIKAAPFLMDFHFKSAHLILLNPAVAEHYGCHWKPDEGSL